MEVKIEKLPLIGSPYSFKTKKQGRRKSINKILKAGATTAQRKYVSKELDAYTGSNRFLLSLKDQMIIKGIEGLTLKQVLVAEKILKNSPLKSANELDAVYQNIIKR